MCVCVLCWLNNLTKALECLCARCAGAIFFHCEYSCVYACVCVCWRVLFPSGLLTRFWPCYLPARFCQQRIRRRRRCCCAQARLLSGRGPGRGRNHRHDICPAQHTHSLTHSHTHILTLTHTLARSLAHSPTRTHTSIPSRWRRCCRAEARLLSGRGPGRGRNHRHNSCPDTQPWGCVHCGCICSSRRCGRAYTQPRWCWCVQKRARVCARLHVCVYCACARACVCLAWLRLRVCLYCILVFICAKRLAVCEGAHQGTRERV